MPSTCIIDFENNPLKVIYAGQLLRGTVALTLTETKSVRGVYIRIRGTAYARWTSGSGRSRSTNTGKEDYLDEKTYFVGGPENTNGIKNGALPFLQYQTLTEMILINLQMKYNCCPEQAIILLNVCCHQVYQVR